MVIVNNKHFCSNFVSCSIFVFIHEIFNNLRRYVEKYVDALYWEDDISIYFLITNQTKTNYLGIFRVKLSFLYALVFYTILMYTIHY